MRWLFAALLVVLVLSLRPEYPPCDGIGVWGNAFRNGVTVYEWQCYRGWFA